VDLLNELTFTKDLLQGYSTLLVLQRKPYAKLSMKNQEIDIVTDNYFIYINVSQPFKQDLSTP